MLFRSQAPANAQAIGSGNFGSLRGQTAVDKAKADAFACLTAQQMQAALQNQATGVNAATGAGTVAQQGIQNQLQAGQYQQAAPFINASNYGKILGGIQAPTTVQNQTQLSPLNQIAGLIAALGGQTGTTGLLGQLGVKNGLQGLLGLGGSTADNSWAGGAGTGQMIDANGNIITRGQFAEFRDSNNTVISSTNTLGVSTLAANWTGLIVKGAASQSANLQEWQNSSGTVRANIYADGYLGLGDNYAVPSTISRSTEIGRAHV